MNNLHPPDIEKALNDLNLALDFLQQESDKDRVTPNPSDPNVVTFLELATNCVLAATHALEKSNIDHYNPTKPLTE